ncbi:MAG: ABC transporter substrate-binding protein [Candidatus Rokuibacteriota bacterium]|jgi:peptide/nickel transport system substrate-binding protein|nr:MAG: ABC transporter substrate-binding protein [Candidatus Rokubacteria bacterium]
MRIHPIRLAALLLVLVLAGLVGGAAGAPPRDAIVIGLVAEPVTMDPPQITDLNSARVTKRIFEGLVGQELGSYKLVPGLAQSWDISRDGLTYTFRLRPNVTFHDGTPFNAEAVKFVFERQLNDKGPYYATGTYPYVKGFLGNVAGVEVLDASTVQIKLKAPLTPFLQYLAHQSLFMFSPESLKKWGKDVVKHPVGTGPFKLETWEPGVKVVLARHDQYWGGAPKIRQAIYVPIVEAQARLVALKTGDIDLTMDVPPDSLDELRRDPNLVVAESNSSAVWYVTLNTRHPILKDRRVRQALNHAVNKEAIIRDILRGTAIVSRGPISPVYGPYYEENTARYPHDLEKARALLKDAGYAGGFELGFLVPESGSGMQSPVEMATVIQANLAQIGVRAKIQTMEWGAYLRKYLEQPDMAEMSWNPSIGDPDHMMYMLLSSDRFPPAFNSGYYQNDRVDDLLRRARTTLDEKARVPLYKEAQKLVVEDAPWIFVDHGKQVIVHRKRVQGFKLHPNFDLVLTPVWLP